MTHTIRKTSHAITAGSVISSNCTSVARLYPQGVSLVSAGRPTLVSISIQNLSATTDVRFWHGLIPVTPLDPDNSVFLPEEPTSWSAGERTQAETTISTYGEKVGPGQYLEPFVTPTQQVYSYVVSGTVAAHVKVG